MGAMKHLVISMMELSADELSSYREAHHPQSTEWQAANDEISRRITAPTIARIHAMRVYSDALGKTLDLDVAAVSERTAREVTREWLSSLIGGDFDVSCYAVGPIISDLKTLPLEVVTAIWRNAGSATVEHHAAFAELIRRHQLAHPVSR